MTQTKSFEYSISHMFKVCDNLKEPSFPFRTFLSKQLVCFSLYLSFENVLCTSPAPTVSSISRKIFSIISTQYFSLILKTRNFDICFCEGFNIHCQKLILGGETGQPVSSPNFEIFPIITKFWELLLLVGDQSWTGTQ